MPGRATPCGASASLQRRTARPTASRRRSRRSITALVVCLCACTSIACSSDRRDAPSDPGSEPPGSTPTTDDGASGASGQTELAANPTEQWVVGLVGPTQEDEVDGLAAADDGSVWITGKFERTAVLGGVELRSAGRADIPLARVEPDGEPAWVTRFGGPGEDNFFDIDAEPGGAVATGWFEGELAIGDTVLDSRGASDCVIASFADDSSVRWVRAFGGPDADGCNEVVVGSDGTVVTSMDTSGRWESPGGPVRPEGGRETVLLVLDANGDLEWARSVGGPGRQRGKALAVGTDGAVAFGGDTVGTIVADGVSTESPGGRSDAWVSLWSADGDLRWMRTWGGAGPDLAKGLTLDEDGVIAVGTVSGRAEIGDQIVDAGSDDDLVVARLDSSGTVRWIGSVRAEGPVTGAEITSSPHGGVLFGVSPVAGMQLVGADGSITEASDAPQLVHWSDDGSVGWTWSVPGPDGGLDEIARSGARVYLDRVVRLDGSNKDAEVVAIDLPAG